MRLLRVVAPGADPRLTASVRDAVRAFNASLDIRLRFLSIGIEETIVEVSGAADAAERVAAAAAPDLRGGPADLLLLEGGGPAAVGAAAASLRARLPVVRAGAGDRTVADVVSACAADRMAQVLLARDAADAAALREEGVSGEVEVVGDPSDPGTGHEIVRAICRARRRERC